MELLENVRGQDVYVVQTGGGDRPNDSLMELLFLINAFRLASADSITVITPFFPYRLSNFLYCSATLNWTTVQIIEFEPPKLVNE